MKSFKNVRNFTKISTMQKKSAILETDLEECVFLFLMLTNEIILNISI